MYRHAIRHKRKQKGLTQDQAAEGTSVSGVSWGRYERGDRQPSPRILEEICEVLETTKDELAEFENEYRESAVEAGAPVKDQPGDYVHSASDVSLWRDQVLRDPRIEGGLESVLVALPLFMDRKSWVVTVDVDTYIKETGRSKAFVEEFLPDAMRTIYVETIGTLKWVARLKFP